MSCCWPPCFSAWVAGIYNPCVTLSELKPPLRHWDEIWTNPWDIIPCKYDPSPAQIQPRVNPGRRVDNKHIFKYFKALFEREGLVTYFGDNARTSKHTWLVALPHRLLLCFEFFPTQAFLAEKRGEKYENTQIKPIWPWNSQFNPICCPKIQTQSLGERGTVTVWQTI